MAQDPELQAIYNVIQQYQEQANVLSEHQEFLLETMQGLAITQATLEELEKVPNNHEIMLPIGNGAYINARVQDPSKILIAISKDVIMEKNLPDARAFTEQRMNKIKDAQTQNQERLDLILKKLDELKAALNQKAGAGTGRQPVLSDDSQ